MSALRRLLILVALACLSAAVGVAPTRAATGDVIGSFPTPAGDPQGLAWDGLHFWHAEDNQKEIFELTTGGGIVSSFDIDPFEDDPRGLTWDGSSLWLAGKQDKRIYQLTTTGTIVSSFDIDPFEDDPQGLTWDGSSLWLAGKQDKRIYQLTTTGTIVSSFSIDAFEGDPKGLTWDGTFLWLAGKGNDTVYQLTTTGTVVSSFATPCGDPRGLTFDGVDFWLACKDDDTVYQLEGPGPPVVTLAKSADRASAAPGDTITYTLTYGNPGTIDVTNLVITDTIPADTTLVPGSITNGGTESGGVITWNPLGTLPAGVLNRTVEFSVTVDAGTPMGTSILNTAVLGFEDMAGNPQPPVGSNTLSVTVEQVGGVTVVEDQIKFVKSATGKQVSYTFTITNTGNGPDFYDLSIIKNGPEYWPAELLDATESTLLAADTDFDGVWDFVNPAFDADADGQPDTSILAQGASQDVVLRFTVPAGTHPGDSDITSLVASSHVGPISDRATASSIAISVTASPILTLAKTDAPDPVTAGNTITYTLTYSNTGNNDATGLILVDSIPADTVYVGGSATGAGGGVTIEFSTDNGGSWGSEPADPTTVTDIRWTLATLKKKKTKTAGFEVQTLISLPDGTLIGNAATLQSNELPDIPAGATTTVSSAVNFTDATKTVSSALASPGDTLTYSIVATNGGTVVGTNVVVTDTIPAETTYLPGSIAGPGADDSGAPNLVWNLGAVPAGAAVGPLTYQVTIDNPIAVDTFSLQNVATVDSNETNPVDTPPAVTVINAAPLFISSTKTSGDVNGGSLLVGEEIEYQIDVINSGDMDASGVLVTDTIPAGTTYLPGSITGPGADDSLAPDLSWSVGALAGGGASVTLTFRVTVDIGLPAGTVINNRASIASDQTAPILTPPTSNTVEGGTTGVITSTSPIVPGATVTLTVTDADLDTDPLTAESFTLTTTNMVTGETELRTYTETGLSTGIFAATVATVFGTVAGANDDGVFNVQAGDTLQTVYSDALTAGGGPGSSTATTIVVAGGVTGTITSTDPILPGDTVTLTLTDADLDTDPLSAETVVLTTTNTITGEMETLTYTETGANTGVFTTSVATVFGTVAGTDDDGVFNVQNGDTLLTIYNDAVTATGGPGVVSATTNVAGAVYQSDAMIKLASEGAGGYLTDDLYESTAAVQAKPQGVVSGTTAAYEVRFQNDGNTTDNLVISGTGSGSGFTVQYLDDTSTDRTAAVTGAGYTIAVLAAGTATVWTVNVTPSGAPTPVTGGTSYSVFVTAVSEADNTKIDQVEAVTSSTSARLTLLKSVDKANASPGEDITYIVNASNGPILTAAENVVVLETVPVNTGFLVGGATFNPGTSTLAFVASYSDDNGVTWTHAPASGGCGAPAGYDDCVTDVKWAGAGSMPTGTDFSVELVVRLK